MPCSRWRLWVGTGLAAAVPWTVSATPACGQPSAVTSTSYASNASPAAAPRTAVELIRDPTRMLAMVGDEPILVGDLMPTANQMLEPYTKQISAEQLEEQRALLLRQLLRNKIDSKLLYLDFLRTIPAAKVKEALENIRKRVDEQFHASYVPELIKKYNVASLAELDGKLRTYGSSLEHAKREYGEQMIARMMIGRNLDRDPEVTHQEMLDYYFAHVADYEFPSKARWEQLTARFDKSSSRAEAEQLIVAMGNEVLRGAPLDAVARRHSQDPLAEQGGEHDWTSQGSLVSEVLDRAIFSLPIGQMSTILEDQQGFHIVRVLERREAGRTPFTEAQDEIQGKLREEKVKKQMDGFVEQVRKKTPVWTAFDALDDTAKTRRD